MVGVHVEFFTFNANLIFHLSICEWRMRYKSFVGCICELPDRSSRRVELRIVGSLRISNGEFILTGPWLVGPIGGGIHPDGSKMRCHILTGPSAQKTFLNENTLISYKL